VSAGDFTVTVEFPTLSFRTDGRMLAVGEMTGAVFRILRAPSFEEIASVETTLDPTATVPG